MKVIADDVQSFSYAENNKFEKVVYKGMTTLGVSDLCESCVAIGNKGDDGVNQQDRAADASAEPDVLAQLSRIDALEKLQDEELAIFEASNQETLAQSTAIQHIETALKLISTKYDTVVQKLEEHKKELEQTGRK